MSWVVDTVLKTTKIISTHDLQRYFEYRYSANRIYKCKNCGILMDIYFDNNRIKSFGFIDVNIIYFRYYFSDGYEYNIGIDIPNCEEIIMNKVLQ